MGRKKKGKKVQGGLLGVGFEGGPRTWPCSPGREVTRGMRGKGGLSL